LKPEILIIGGPTASGKNELALAVARKLPSELINADSRQVYRELQVGTNQPSGDEKAEVPHHLFAFLSPETSFSAADYERLAFPLIGEIQARKKLPIVVGGTGFYIKSLLRGVWPVPEKDAVLRERIREIAQSEGNAYLYRILQRLDPESALEISVNDVYRVSRAVEIIIQTGKKRSEHRGNRTERFNAAKFYIDPGRSQLKKNVQARTIRMLETGWLEEVRGLLNRYPDFENFPAARALGYPEVIAFLKSKQTLEVTREQIIQKTMQYAKRQLTWFRNQDNFVRISSRDDLHKIVDSVLQ
jgi:tRNA dimethylallyltransferase